jgi:hypothetical protein
MPFIVVFRTPAWVPRIDDTSLVEGLRISFWAAVFILNAMFFRPFISRCMSGAIIGAFKITERPILRICSVAEANKPKNYQGQCKGTHSRLPDLFHPKSSLILWCCEEAGRAITDQQFNVVIWRLRGLWS